MKPKHIKSPNDLQTTHKAIVDGFLEQSIAKNDKANPYIKDALRFFNALKKCKTLEDVLNLQDFRNELIAAGGFSDKSKSKFSAAELNNSLKKVLEKIFEGSNHNFREEIVFRYLLTKGDSLGGSMRNLTGSLASRKLISIIKMKLEKNKEKAVFNTSKSGKVQSIKWGNRVLFFDVTPRFIRKNIDIILLRFDGKSKEEKDLLHTPQNYIACGELKGGIDPAGADEHWKTANSALGRIRRSFEIKDQRPKLFFIGAAIEASMSQEIYSQLKKGKLTHAANLTVEKQVEDLVDWLVEL